MNNSLSVLIPIHNAQSTLATDVTTLLEVAAELTSDVDVLILDDGSTDGTEEVAWELTTRFSQVSYVRYPEQRGLVSALRTGLPETHGDYVLVCNTERRLSWDNLSRLWSERRTAEAVSFAQAEDHEPRWLQRLMQWGKVLRDENQHSMNTPFTMRLLERDDVAAWNALDAALGRPYLERLRKRDSQETSQVPAPAGDSQRLDQANVAGGPAWANVAGHIHDFAVGE